MKALINLFFILLSWTVISQDSPYVNTVDKLKSMPTESNYTQAYDNVETSLRSIEIKGFYTLSKRAFISSENSDYAPCGHCSISYFANNSQKLVSGFGLGLNFSQKRFYSSLEISLEQYAYNIYAGYGQNNYHPHLPWGSIDDHYSEIDYFSATEGRLKVLTGVGIRILHPRRRFNIIPMIKISGGVSIKQTINDNHFEKSRVYEWTGSPTPETNYAWDSTFTPSRITTSKRNFDLMLGIGFTYRVINNFRINIDLFYAAYSTATINVESFKTIDRLRIYGSIGIGYVIPLKSRLGRHNHGRGRLNEQ